MLDRRPLSGMLAGRILAGVLLLAALLQTDAQNDTLPVHIYPDDSASTLAEQLEDAMWRSADARHSAIVIHSDGYWPSPARASIESARAAGAPVFWHALAREEAGTPVIAVHMPDVARPGQRVSIGIEVAELPERPLQAMIFQEHRLLVSASLVAPETFLELLVDRDFALSLDLEIATADAGEVILPRQPIGVINVLAAPRLLLLASGASALGTSLSHGGWPVTIISPAEFPAYSAALGSYRALILDDVAWHALPATQWQRVANAVRDEGLGLIVSGGPNSFALGGYRATELESLLPLVSEPPEREPAAAVALLLDVSGSMNREPMSRLSIARSAALAAVQSLRPKDQVGLYSFDADARRLLPLAARSDHAAAVAEAWPDAAGGGTRVAAALELAVADLNDLATAQQLVFLVTDGMLSDADIDAMSAQIADTPVQLVALIIADGQRELPLKKLSDSQQIRLLPVADVAQLPVLMQGELETLGPALVQQRTQPVRVGWASAFDDGHWPALTAYTQTRARPAAHIKLQAQNGDPLLAQWSVGAASVVALPGGLGGWAQEWLTWEHWPLFVADLVSSVASADTRGLSVLRQSSNQTLLVETRDAVTGQPNARLARPGEPVLNLVPELVAPRRYALSLPQSSPGPAALLWNNEVTAARHEFFLSPTSAEIIDGGSLASALLREGLIQEWQGATNKTAVTASGAQSWLAAMALFTLLATIALERLPFRRPYAQKR